MRTLAKLMLAGMFLGLALAQAPGLAVNPSGIVNAATYQTTVAPGSIAAIFGNLLVPIPSASSGVPLPTSLAQLSFSFANQYPAPLFFVSSAQANVQIPWELAGETQAAVIPTFNGLPGQAQAVAIAPFAPGIFTTNGQGSGQGAIQDSSYHLLDASNPAGAGITVAVIYCTGLGAVASTPQTGAAAPALALATTTTMPIVTIGGASATVLFSGLAPGTVGEYQVNARVPSNSQLGDSVPVSISIGGVSSNTVTIAVATPTPAQRAAQLVSEMTEDEKVQLVHGGEAPGISVPRGVAGWVPGIPRLGIPDLYLADGSVGVGNGVGPATALPSSLASAASWDLNEAYKYGSVIGAELRNYGINGNLGGNVNLIGREPRDGRAFETKGEDPILAGKIAAAHIRAIQDQHVLGCMKHFAFNDQETGRNTANAEIDERSARESDLLAFEITLKDSNVQSVMCAYNLLNGIYSCENPFLLNQVLKSDWTFTGFVMSDWGATHSTVAAALAGLDQEQPDGQYFSTLGTALQGHQVPPSRLDDMVQRILTSMFTAGLFDYPSITTPVNTVADQAIAQDAEEQGAVLLKNENAELPLQASALKSVAVIGSHADIAVLSGGGSAQVMPTGGPALTQTAPCPPCWAPVVWDPSSPLKAIQAMAPGAVVTFVDGGSAASTAALAAKYDKAIVFVSQWASEGMDIPSLNFTDLVDSTPVNQDALVAAVAAANPHTIVVLENGGAQVMPWLNSVAAVIEAWYPGQRGGPAIANLLFGAVNPSGKLPITFPASVSDLPRPVIPQPPDATTPFNVDYFEGFDVGYKWYDAKQLTPLFPFGFGLSYTTFSFSNWTLINNLSSANPNFQVTFQIANTGKVAGAEVAQVYLSLPAAIADAPRRLVGWQKMMLQPNGQQQVTIEVDENDSSHPLSYWDTTSETWRLAPGDYIVYAGNSSSASALTTIGTLHIAE